MPTDERSQPDRPALDPAPPAAFGGAPFPYLRWAKRWLVPDDLSLGLSGLAALTPAVRADLGLAAPLEVGDARAGLKAALAARYGVGPENVYPTAGTSHANFIAFFALARGGHIVVETPTYEALPSLAAAVGSGVTVVRRDPTRGWRFDARSLEHALRPATALIAVTDLHNPSGVRLHPDDLDLLVAAAERTGAWLLVDEVYADFDPLDRPTAARHHPRILTTNSLTKAHGLPDLRAGWILADAPVIRTIEGWDDLVHPVQPTASLADAGRYVPQARTLLEITRARAAHAAAIVDAWVHATDGVHWVPPDGGLTGLLLFEDGVDGDDVAARLASAHGVRAVPGSFFQVRGGLRISYLLEDAHLHEALAAIGAVLASLR